jgi:hypothetical protein
MISRVLEEKNNRQKEIGEEGLIVKAPTCCSFASSLGTQRSGGKRQRAGSTKPILIPANEVLNNDTYPAAGNLDRAVSSRRVSMVTATSRADLAIAPGVSRLLAVR